MSPTELLKWFNFVPPTPYQHFKPFTYVDPNGEYFVIHLWGGKLHIKSNKNGTLSGYIEDTSG